jgi:hypothetical protein
VILKALIAGYLFRAAWKRWAYREWSAFWLLIVLALALTWSAYNGFVISCHAMTETAA